MLNAVRNRQRGLDEKKLCRDSLTKLLYSLQCVSGDSHPVCDDMRQFSPLSMDWHPDGTMLMASDEGGFIRMIELGQDSSRILDRKYNGLF